MPLAPNTKVDQEDYCIRYVYTKLRLGQYADAGRKIFLSTRLGARFLAREASRRKWSPLCLEAFQWKWMLMHPVRVLSHTSINQCQYDFQSTWLNSSSYFWFSSGDWFYPCFGTPLCVKSKDFASWEIPKLPVNLLCLSVGAIWGWCSWSENCYEKLRSKVCTGETWIITICTWCLTHTSTFSKDI